ncbi:hypothetical protein DFS34DRAFT_649922 [Phlyctochytrium arcticum]|nr:hypothetical protein DFS34DRAFT_649922 [Phlyctochytrium arcticum]
MLFAFNSTNKIFNKEGSRPCKALEDETVTFPFNFPPAIDPPIPQNTTTSVLNAFNYISVDYSVISVAPDKLSFTVHFEFLPKGDLSTQLPSTIDSSQADVPDEIMSMFGTNANGDPIQLRTDVNLTIGSHQLSFKNGQSMGPADLNFPISGDVNKYPFDKWRTLFRLSGTFTNRTANATQAPLSILLNGNAPLAAYSVEFVRMCDASLNRDGTALVFAANIRRALTTKVFVVILTVFMWILSLSVMAVALSVWFRGRKVEPPTIAVAVSMLFALPSIRNSQPLAPPIGSTVDVVGFFWNLVIVAVAASSLLINYITHTKAEFPQSKNNTPSTGSWTSDSPRQRSNSRISYPEQVKFIPDDKGRSTYQFGQP